MHETVAPAETADSAPEAEPATPPSAAAGASDDREAALPAPPAAETTGPTLEEVTAALAHQEAPAPPPESGPPFQLRTRLLHVLAGAVLAAIFFLPWNGARSWELLPLLRGADFARQLLYLVAGATLLSTGVLPVPVGFRAAIGALLGVLGLGVGGVLLSFWQGLLALLVLVLLPASLLLRSKVPAARLPQLLGLLAVLSLLCLYLVPRDGVPPLRVAVELIYYQKDEMARFIGTYLLLPLPLCILGTMALLSDDVAPIGELITWPLIGWAPGAILVLAIDRTQVYMAAAVLSYSLCAGYGVAELVRRLVVRLGHETLPGPDSGGV